MSAGAFIVYGVTTGPVDTDGFFPEHGHSVNEVGTGLLALRVWQCQSPRLLELYERQQ